MEPLYGFSATLNEGEQGAKSLTVSGIRTENNIYGFDMIQQRNYFVYEGEEFLIEKRGRRVVGNSVKIDCQNDHRFFSDLRGKRIYDSYKGTFSLTYLFTLIFQDTGYTFSFNPIDLAETLKYDDFGKDNKLALFQKVIADLGAEFDYSSNVVFIAKQLGVITDKQFLYKYNISDIAEDTDSSNFSTFIKGYGKPKEEKDVATNSSFPYASRTGEYYTEPTENKPATKQIGATFSFTFTGTGFSFKTLVHKMGGKWTFEYGDTSKTITTYAEATSEKTFNVVRGLESKEYSVKATFKKDSDNPNTKAKGTLPFNYLLDGNILTNFRQLIGDEQYTTVVEYTSPLATEYGIIEAEPVFSDTITDAATMTNVAKKSLYDSWDISISLTAQELAEMGLSDLNRLDYAYCLLDPLSVDLQLRIVQKESYSDPYKSPSFTFGTIKKKGTNTIANLSSSSKSVSKIVDSKTGQIKTSAISNSMSFNLAYAVGVLTASKVSIGPETVFAEGYNPTEFEIPSYGLASATENGLMSSADFLKLASIQIDENGNISINIPLASSTENGLMTKEDFAKLSRILFSSEETIDLKTQVLDVLADYGNRIAALEGGGA